MTILEMLKLRCAFQKNPVSEAGAEMPELPEDIRELYREADGGQGTISQQEWKDGPDLILYSRKEMAESKQWFAEYSAAVYGERFFPEERSLTEQEEAQLDRIGRDVTVLGQCGDEDFPDYLVRYRDTYFLIPRGSLDFPFRKELALEEEDCYTKGSYPEFLAKVLWRLEAEEL